MKVLIVESRESQSVLSKHLQGWNHSVRTATDLDSALTQVRTFEPSLVIVHMGDASALSLVRRLESDHAVTVFVTTRRGSVNQAVEAMKCGARDCFSMPLNLDEVKAAIDELARELGAINKANFGVAGGPGGLIGTSPAMREVYDLIARLAPTDTPVLITGESGTGKELVSRAIHELSRRRDKTFLPVNAAAIPSELMESEIFGHEKGAFTGAGETRRGCFELADKGTLFLDEIAEMRLSLQPKLLRILEDGKVRRLGAQRELAVNTRVIAATNRKISEAIADGQLRPDLYHRLNVFSIHLPPLRLRSGDLELLQQHFIARFNGRHGTQIDGVSEEAAELLKRHTWPGNVRELRNVMERAVVLAHGGDIAPVHLPPLESRSVQVTADELRLPIGISVAEAEKHLILRTLESVQNNKAAAARRLGIDVKTIRNKLRHYEASSLSLAS